MTISSAQFVTSSPLAAKCPRPDRPEYAFIGRSNVGKSSLINTLLQQRNLAKVSGKPGKTQLINHFDVNGQWYLVDLPGYGFAKVSKEQRAKWEKMIAGYIGQRPNLMSLFVLVDARLDAQEIDLKFMQWLGENGVPFTILFTKSDKLGKVQVQKNMAAYRKVLLEFWEELPPMVVTSAADGRGRDEVLTLIESWNARFTAQN